LTFFLLVACFLAFPEWAPFAFVAVLVLELWRRYRDSTRREKNDREVLELMFRLSARGSLTEETVSEEMGDFSCLARFAGSFKKTGRLTLPNFGWRSLIAAMAIRTALETGDSSVLTKALEQISRREEAMVEAGSMLASQKYTLVASIAVSSAILGVASSISGQSYLYYVIAQSLLSALWLKFLGGNFYESLSLSVPLSLAGHFLAARFV